MSEITQAPANKAKKREEKRKARSKVADYAVFLVIRVVVAFLQALSFEKGCGIARLLAWVVYKLDKRHRNVALENIEHAFPGKYTDEQRHAIVLNVYTHFLTMLIEIVHMPRRLHIYNWRRYAELVNGGVMVDALLSDRPLLIVTGHYGNWEMAGYALGLFGFRTYAIARPLDNPYLDDFLRGFRERTGQRLLAKHGDFDKMQKILDEGGAMATLADQDAGHRGVFVDYFGRPASTHKAVALMAIEHDVLIAVAGTPKIRGSYQITTGEVVDPRDFAGSPNAVKNLTQSFTTALEKLVRIAPHQYFWVHRRWKSQPKSRTKKPEQKAAA